MSTFTNNFYSKDLKKAFAEIEKVSADQVYYMNEVDYRDMVERFRSDENKSRESIDELIARLKEEAEVEVHAGITFYKVGKIRFCPVTVVTDPKEIY